MANNFAFLPPAGQVDFPNNAALQAALVAQWNTNLNGFIQQGMAGSTWNMDNMPPTTNYFNPLDTAIPSSAITPNIEWQAFPGRISFYFPKLSATDVLSLGDTGYLPDGKTSFGTITTNPCPDRGFTPTVYGPYGPRGWQDEYCEWAVTRNSDNKITRIDFTCENPEYWNTLWMADPQTALSIYQTTLNKPQIQLEDLYLYDQNGNVVNDPSTGKPAYNPLNKWNSGPFSTDSAGGAMHLTSTPNTLQTETGLACASTVQRTIGNTDFNTLICCAQYGQPHRNSDPNIGGTVNQVVNGGIMVTLANPPGLYIQMPNFSAYKTPDGTPAASFWKIVRGQETLNDSNGNPMPGNFILHAVFEVPAGLGYTVSDISINGEPIVYGGQVTQTFNMQIVASAFTGSTPAAIACSVSKSQTDALAQPLQMFYAAVFNAMANDKVANPVAQPMTLVSNSTLIAPIIKQGGTGQMALTCDTLTAIPGDSSTWPVISFDGTDLTANITSVGTVNYAVPGNSYPGSYSVLYFDLSVANNAKTGLRNVYVTNPGQAQGAAMPALLNVEAS